MKNDSYVWDKSGTPDPVTVRLETTLRDLRHTPERPVWLREYAANAAADKVTPELETLPPMLPAPRPRWWAFWSGWAVPLPQTAFALIALGCLAGGWWMAVQSRQVQPAQGLARTAGVPPGLSQIELRQAALTPLAPLTPSLPVAVRTRPAAWRGETVRRAVALTPAVKLRRPVVAQRTASPAPEVPLTPAEAAKAKADLMIALRVINDKLDLAQRNLEGHTLRLPELTDTAR